MSPRSSERSGAEPWGWAILINAFGASQQSESHHKAGADITQLVSATRIPSGNPPDKFRLVE